MKILICGDVVGKAGRRVIEENLPDLRQRLDLDFVIVNGENAAHGFGITDKICAAFYAAGADVIEVFDVRAAVEDTLVRDVELRVRVGGRRPAGHEQSAARR